MSSAWLANADPATAWAHFPWTAFGREAAGPGILAVLPVHGLADHGLGLPLDAEEVVGSAILRRAVAGRGDDRPIRVLPPLRFALAPYPSTFFGIDPETAHALILEIAGSVQAAGIERLVFFNTSPWNGELVDAASLEARVRHGLRTYVINLPGLGLDFHPGRDGRAQAQAAAARLLGCVPEVRSRPGEVLDPDFRPGQYRQPPPLAFTGTVDGAAVITAASGRLTRLLAEIAVHRLPGISPSPATPPPVVSSLPADPVDDAPWPPERARSLAAFTREALEALPDKDSALVILPTGAVEQHGHHLPVGVDAIVGQALLHHTLPLLPPEAPVYVAPPLTFGRSPEHADFPGTITLSARTLRRLVLAVASQIRALGFRRLAILNTHGGNSAVLVYTVRELQDGDAFRVGLLSGYANPDQHPQEAAFGFHAGEWETSLMLACAPALVRMDHAVCEYPARLSDETLLRTGNAPATFSWLTRDLSTRGVMGDATLATQEKGIRWLTQAALALADRIEQTRKGP